MWNRRREVAEDKRRLRCVAVVIVSARGMTRKAKSLRCVRESGYERRASVRVNPYNSVSFSHRQLPPSLQASSSSLTYFARAIQILISIQQSFCAHELKINFVGQYNHGDVQVRERIYEMCIGYEATTDPSCLPRQMCRLQDCLHPVEQSKAAELHQYFLRLSILSPSYLSCSIFAIA